MTKFNTRRSRYYEQIDSYQQETFNNFCPNAARTHLM